mgnify:CR=1 FL=1
MIGLSCTAGAVLALCGQVRGTLERKGLPQKELDGGRVRIEPRYNQGSGFGLVPLNGRQMAPLSLAALWALLGVCGGRGLGAGLLLGGPGLSALSKGAGAAEEIHLQSGGPGHLPGRCADGAAPQKAVI